MSFAKRGSIIVIDASSFVFESTRTGYSAYSPEYPGVGVAANSQAEATQMLMVAITLYLEDDKPSPGRLAEDQARLRP